MKALLALAGTLAALTCGLGLLAALLGASDGEALCASAPPSASGAPDGSWVASAYGPPWGGIEGDGVTASGIDLRDGRPALEVAVDPRVIALGSWVYVWPNPFGTRGPFYAGDTGGAISGRHLDVYDWRGRASQRAWGVRSVSVSIAAEPPGARSLAGALVSGEGEGLGCESALAGGALQLSAGERARILPDGSAAAPADAPAAVKLAIAAGNLIHTKPYPVPDVHYGSLARLWPAYDCSGAVSFVLYGAGLLGASALDSSGLESYGLPGPGKWITLYANASHSWIVVAGIAFDTSAYGGPSLPAGSGPRWRPNAAANLRDGLRYRLRHPVGL